MFTPRRLFARRLKEEWKFQIKAWRIVVDWIVALYILVPFAAFAVYQYVTWWSGPPVWMEYLPFPLVVAALFLYTCTGEVRLFVQEGDQLFLLQQKAWIKKLIGSAVLYSLIMKAVFTAFWVAVLAPYLLLEIKLSPIQLVVLGTLIWLVRINRALVVQFIAVAASRWRRFVYYIGVYSAAAALLVFAGWLLTKHGQLSWAVMSVCVLLLFAAIYLTNRRKTLRGALFYDLAREQKERMKYVTFILAQHLPKRQRWQRKRPLMFRSSNLLFRNRTPVNGLAEWCIKTLLRRRRQLLLYAQFAVYGAVGTVLLPFAVKWILWIGLAFLLAYWMRMLWREVPSDAFVAMFKWKDQVLMEAAAKSTMLLSLPAYLVISLALGLSVFPWWKAILMLPVGGAVMMAVAGLISSFGAYK